MGLGDVCEGVWSVVNCDTCGGWEPGCCLLLAKFLLLAACGLLIAACCA